MPLNTYNRYDRPTLTELPVRKPIPLETPVTRMYCIFGQTNVWAVNQAESQKALHHRRIETLKARRQAAKSLADHQCGYFVSVRSLDDHDVLRDERHLLNWIAAGYYAASLKPSICRATLNMATR